MNFYGGTVQRKSLKSLDALEASWEQKLHQSHSFYKRAAEQHRRMEAELERNPDARAEGAFAVAKARRLVAITRQEFFQSLRVYADFVGRRKAPPTTMSERHR